MFILANVVCLLGCIVVSRTSVVGENYTVQSVLTNDLETNLIVGDDVENVDPPKNISTDGQSVVLPYTLATDGERGSTRNCSGQDNVVEEVGIQPPRNESTSDVGVRLILTGMVEAGNISEARRLSQVSGGPFPAHIASYSGFLTVDHRFNSNLLFWFFPCETRHESAPLLLWLQGGPGDSSLMGLFNELGPFSVAADGTTLVENPNSWHKNYSIIFIDNPVGSGFSFTDTDEGYATNQTQIGESLYTALIQFFKLFPELQKNDFYLTGLSYAGKYIPTLGYIIHTRNEYADLKINLKGLAVGNGYTDPISMTELHKTAYQMGLIDSGVRDRMQIVEREIREAVIEGDMMKAARKKTFNYQLFGFNSQYSHGYNLLHASEPYNEYGFSDFFQSADVRMRLHVGDAEFTTDREKSTKVFNVLYPQTMVSVKPALEELLEHYRVLYYSGQLDLAVTYPMSVNMYKSLNWTAAEEYKHAERVTWYVNGEVAGYMKSAGKFTEVLVRNAGHVVAYDQPVWARDLMNLFTTDNLPTPRP